MMMSRRPLSSDEVARSRSLSTSSLMLVLFNVRVGDGDVRLRLVVVVVADEIFHGIVGEELPELAVELGRQRLVVRQHQHGPFELRNGVGDGERSCRNP
jgi:hypothetical protein